MKKEKTETKTIKITFPVGVTVALNVLAAMRSVTRSEYLRSLVDIAEKYLDTHGRHITDDPFLNPAPPIAQIIKDTDWQSLVDDVQIPMERLEKITAGDRPTDSDLSFLAAANSIPYTLEQLFQGRKLQFDHPEEVKNAVE